VISGLSDQNCRTRMEKIFSHSYQFDRVLEVYSREEKSREEQKKFIGNKAKSLLQLADWGFSIPGSVILDYSFHNNSNPDAVIPDAIFRCIADKLSSKLAIRSSCSIEDGQNRSYTGCFTTALNVSNEYDGISNAIQECYQSLARFRSTNQRDGTPVINMGVIIQSMIVPYVSGVIFTCPPVNPDDNYYLIEYSIGDGALLTSGKVSGNLIGLKKKTGKIIRQKGGLFIRQELINQLWEIAKKLEKSYNFPQDAEFVISKENNQIHLVQSRPITAFHYSPEYVLRTEKKKIRMISLKDKTAYGCSSILTASNISELFPRAIPLGYSIFRTIFAGTKSDIGSYSVGRRHLGYATINKEEQTRLFLTIADQTRVDLQVHASVYRLKGIEKNLYIKTLVSKYLDAINKNPDMANYAQFGLYIQNPTIEECKELFGNEGEAIFHIYSNFLNELLVAKIPEIQISLPHFLEKNHEYYQNEIADGNDEITNKSKLFIKDEKGSIKLAKEFKPAQLIEKFKQYLNYLREDLGVKYVIVARIAFLSSDIVKNLLKRMLKAYPDLFVKDKIAESETAYINNCFNELLCNENIKTDFDFENSASCGSDNNKAELMGIREIRELYGYSGSLDISQPRLGELKDDLLRQLFAEKNEAKKNEIESVTERLLHFTNSFKALQLDSTEEFQDFYLWVHYSAQFMNYREKMKSELLKVLYLMRIIVRELSLPSHFDLGDLIYYLECEDLEGCINKLDKYRFIALKRKAYFNACKLVEVKKILLANKKSSIRIKAHQSNVQNQSYQTVKGTTICHGKAEGFCLIAKTPNEFYEKLIEFRSNGIENIIGVFESVDLAYVNITELKGFITEHGGYLAHAATIARENNFPYISNLKIGLFKNYQYIVFDTSNNQVIYRE
jgi:phosphoenolpyruvate synthase/pyruvate phosphate dikinase